MLLEAARRGVRVNIIVYKEVKEALTCRFHFPQETVYLYCFRDNAR
jgi:hypothetical protein